MSAKLEFWHAGLKFEIPATLGPYLDALAEAGKPPPAVRWVIVASNGQEIDGSVRPDDLELKQPGYGTQYTTYDKAQRVLKTLLAEHGVLLSVTGKTVPLAAANVDGGMRYLQRLALVEAAEVVPVFLVHGKIRSQPGGS